MAKPLPCHSIRLLSLLMWSQEVCDLTMRTCGVDAMKRQSWGGYDGVTLNLVWGRCVDMHVIETGSAEDPGVNYFIITRHPAERRVLWTQHQLVSLRAGAGGALAPGGGLAALARARPRPRWPPAGRLRAALQRAVALPRLPHLPGCELLVVSTLTNVSASSTGTCSGTRSGSSQIPSKPSYQTCFHKWDAFNPSRADVWKGLIANAVVHRRICTPCFLRLIASATP